MNALALVVFSQLAIADVSNTAPAAQPAAGSPHLRFGIAHWAAYGEYPLPAGGGGFSLHAGVQVDDRLALYLLAQGATTFFAGLFTASAMIEWSPVSWLGLAAGAGVSGGYQAGLAVFPSAPGPGWEKDSLAAGLPVRLTLSWGPGRDGHGFRNRVFLAVDAFAGARLDRGPGSPFAVMAGVGLGYQLM